MPLPENIPDQITLREFIERIFDEREKQYAREFQSLQSITTAALASHKELHALESRSVDVAREELNHWKADHNQLQKQMKDAESLFLKTVDYQTAHQSLVSEIGQVRRLLYMGVGLCLGLNFAAGILVTIWIKTH